MSFKKLFVLILVGGILAVTLAGVWYWNSNKYSKGSLKLEIIGPDEADLAQEVEYLVKYKNNGNTRLEDPKLIFQFPEHSLVDQQREKIELDEIYPGQEKTKKFTGRLLGKEGQAQVAKAWLNYRPKNLKARFESNTTHTTIIKEVPLTFEFDLPSEVKPNSKVDFNLNYFSNVDYPLSDLRVQLNYPSDFEFESASPEGLSETEWKLGLLNRAQGGRIKIEGKLKGEIGEEKIFKGKLGVWQDGNFVTLKKTSRGLQLGEPSLYISQEVNGSPKYVASPGETLHYEIYFKNVGQEALTDMFLAANLKGDGFNYNSLKAPRGYFRAGDNSVVFDSRRISKLQFLDVGQEGKVEFWIDVKKDWNLQGDQKPTLVNQVFLSQAQEEFVTKVSSGLTLEQEVYRENEVFHNTGPIPPEVDETTEYLVMWKPKASFNKVEDVQVKSSLPETVELTGNIFPEQEASKFALDSESGQLVWNVGDLGGTTTSSNISFQVELTPDSSQQGTTPQIIKRATISGVDVFTEEKISATSSAVDTTLPDDDSVSKQDGVVR